MAVKPWRATSIQMLSERATQAPDNEAARVVIQRNLDRLLGLIEQACASSEKPDLVVFPEFALQGPPLSMTVGPWIERACSTIPGPLTEPLQALAKREGIFIAGNMFEAPSEWPGRYFNSSFLIGRDGEIVVNYRRVNTAAFPSVHDFMSDYLDATPEDQVFPIADTELGRLALIPCGEINVPEVARCYMMQGAEVILHPTNSKFTTGQEAAKVSRAAENMCYLISANVAGPIGFSPDNSIVGGRSHILDHFGDTIAFEEGAEEGVGVSGIIDIEKLRLDRRTDTGTHNPLLRARFEMYRPYYQQAAFYPPDHFRDTPMADAAETKAAVDIARTNLERARVLEPLSER
ncbi:nitrilase-related carbon-nitrogen hydrolase [Rhizobium sp. S152]|uniref:nitrilase-related carbon-nitrogen hydrolase n=1 Tax=Rhizobium sp. S152 TaxID=3055038 RepID=UPI0025AA1AB4|nr:nitrilase-related carbon-nitrogen hydrolase [Rhizobium sp. S152]MDM9627507.1 nitrilase-related carbon-nitrogen hydrolase [Rhizobium sp. S152]